jgi:hypothetical protein
MMKLWECVYIYILYSIGKLVCVIVDVVYTRKSVVDVCWRVQMANVEVQLLKHLFVNVINLGNKIK